MPPATRPAARMTRRTRSAGNFRRGRSGSNALMNGARLYGHEDEASAARIRNAGRKWKRPLARPLESGVPMGIRTPVTAVKGQCPRPLDDRDFEALLLYSYRIASAAPAGAGSVGGGKRDRTADLLHAMQALSQLSYTPDRGRE